MMLGMCQFTLAQNAEEKERIAERGCEAIKMMDNGFVDESIDLLRECERNDPTNLTYPYEIAYAHTLKKIIKERLKYLSNGAY